MESSVRRNLFCVGFANNSGREKRQGGDGSSSGMQCIEASELSTREVGTESSESTENFEEPSKMASAKDPSQKILIIGVEMAKEFHKQLADTEILEDIKILACAANELMAFCGSEKFLLIFVDMSCEGNNVLKICSTLRYNSNSLNRTVSIIGVTAGGIQGMPLTPESPEDDIVTARKAAEIIKETEEQSLLNVHVEGCEQTRDHNPTSTCEESNSSILQRQPHMTCTEYSQQSDRNNVPPQLTLPNSQELYRIPINTKDTTRMPVNGHFQEEPYLQRLGEHPINHGPQGHFPGHVLQNIGIFSGPSGSLDQFPALHVDSYPFHGHVTSNMCQHSHPSTVPTSLPCRPVIHYPMGNTYGALPVKAQERSIPVKGSLSSTSTSSSSFQAPVGRVQSLGSPAYMVSGTPGTKDMKITLLHDDLSKHSSKERIRRERIKESCDQLRFLLPNITGKKTDMASILEMTVKFVRLVNERIPAHIMQEIAGNLSASGTVQSRKRALKDQNVKQAKPRLSPQICEGLQRPVSVMPSLMPEDQLRARTQTMASSSGPVYLPHVHMGPGQHSISHQSGYGYPLQASVVNYGGPCANMPKDIQYPVQTSVVNYGMAGGISKDGTIVQPVVRQSVNESQLRHSHAAGNPQIGVCPHRQIICTTPLAVNTAVHNDMPQQWNFLKLPPVSTISPCSSNTDLSQSSINSVDQESVGSGRLTPDAAMASPIWEET